jgi:2-keto-4-pentenoate hydratase/2-oxohepta-3-ene-1,7-dioic acid hydratase in catechol pathway
MRIANHEGRLVVVTGGEGHEVAHDVEKNSGGRFGPEPQAIYEDWDAFAGWAVGTRWEGGAPLRPNGLGSPVPAPRQVFGIGLNYRDHAAESGLPVPTSQLIFSVPVLVANLSASVVLLPGDVIFTGTPAGVGLGRDPQRWLADGDVLTSHIEGIGDMRHRFVVR